MEIQEVVMDDTCKNNVLIVDNMRNDRYLNFTGRYLSFVVFHESIIVYFKNFTDAKISEHSFKAMVTLVIYVGR